jgi:hypothetical protein
MKSPFEKSQEQGKCTFGLSYEQLKAIAEFGKRRQHNLMLSLKKGNDIAPN